MKLHYLNETPKKRDAYAISDETLKYRTLCQKDVKLAFVTHLKNPVTCKTCRKGFVSAQRIWEMIVRGPRHVDCDCSSCRL